MSVWVMSVYTGVRRQKSTSMDRHLADKPCVRSAMPLRTRANGPWCREATSEWQTKIASRGYAHVKLLIGNQHRWPVLTSEGESHGYLHHAHELDRSGDQDRQGFAQSPRRCKGA